MKQPDATVPTEPVIAQASPPPIQPREPVTWFAGVMETKLRENDHKGGWRDCDFDYLEKRIREEPLQSPRQRDCMSRRDDRTKEGTAMMGYGMTDDYVEAMAEVKRLRLCVSMLREACSLALAWVENMRIVPGGERDKLRQTLKLAMGSTDPEKPAVQP